MRRLIFQSLSTIAVAVSLLIATPAEVMAQGDDPRVRIRSNTTSLRAEPTYMLTLNDRGAGVR